MPENNPSPVADNVDLGNPESDWSSSTIQDVSGSIISIIVWLVIILGVLYAIFRSDTAEVFLNARTTDHLVVDGAITSHRGPIKNGTVQIVLENAKSKRYLGSSVLQVLDGGRFTNESKDLLGSALLSESLRLTAKFTGQFLDNDGKTLKPLSGEQIVYVNFTPPLSKQSLSIVTGIIITLMLVLIILFTGDLTRRKARVLFSVTYFITFLSLAVPIALTLLVSQNLYLVELMEEAPIGLIKGTAKGVVHPQWLVNIGGAVRQPQKQTSKPTESKETPQSTDQKSSTLISDSEKSSLLDTKPPQLGSGNATVEGGLAVPFYVIILATLGAGINMTRSVPKIQQEYDISGLAQTARPLWRTTLTFLSHSDDLRITKEQRKVASSIRKSLIENYMYLSSAPFLAITVYYLLQVIAESVAGPVLVLMAFATGLVADTIISWIIDFARKTLKGDEANANHVNAQPAAVQQS